MPDKKKYKLILFGATSFVGQIAARYLLQKYGSDGEVSWAVAARSVSKLNELKRQLGVDDLPVIVADGNDAESLVVMARQAEVVATTVGPYANYGEAVLEACIEQGTHYCDLTGEVQWIYSMLKKYEHRAVQTGAMVVHCCGFDSIPSDLGVWFLQQQSILAFGVPCEKVEMLVKVLKGGVSGGTVASLINVVEETRQSPALKRVLANPYSLCPQHHGFTTRQPTDHFGYSDMHKSWRAPFIMAAINTRLVHRTNALLQQLYGHDFTYSEAMMTGNGAGGWLRAMATTAATAMLMLAIYFRPARWLLKKTVLPALGSGPSPMSQENGFYDLRFSGRCSAALDNGCNTNNSSNATNQIVVKVTGDKDPGYGSTAKMLIESGLCIGELSSPGGFYTPASLMPEQLIKRLTSNAGMVFERVS